MRKLILLLLLVGCQTTDSYVPKKQPKVLPPQRKLSVAPEDVFVSEFDWCWARYVECQKFFTKKFCFPAQEECAVKAYRKLKKARKDGDPI